MCTILVSPFSYYIKNLEAVLEFIKSVQQLWSMSLEVQVPELNLLPSLISHMTLSMFTKFAMSRFSYLESEGSSNIYLIRSFFAGFK